MEFEAHEGQHQNCRECFAIKIRSIQFQGMEAGQHRFTDKERSRDMDAYKTMRRQGIQPKNIFGSAEVAAQASSTFEAEHSVVMASSIRKEMEARRADMKEIINS